GRIGAAFQSLLYEANRRVERTLVGKSVFPGRSQDYLRTGAARESDGDRTWRRAGAGRGLSQSPAGRLQEARPDRQKALRKRRTPERHLADGERAESLCRTQRALAQ